MLNQPTQPHHFQAILILCPFPFKGPGNDVYNKNLYTSKNTAPRKRKGGCVMRQLQTDTLTTEMPHTVHLKKKERRMRQLQTDTLTTEMPHTVHLKKKERRMCQLQTDTLTK